MKKYKIYSSLVVIGLFCIMLAVVPVFNFMSKTFQLVFCSDQFNNIMISLGTGIITSSIVALLIDKSNEKINENNSLKFKSVILSELNFQIEGYLLDIDQGVYIDQLLRPGVIDATIVECNRIQFVGGIIFNNEEIAVLETININSRQLKKSIEENRIREMINKYSDLFNDCMLDDYNLRFDNYNRYERINGRVGISDEDRISIEFFCIQCSCFRDALNKYKEVFKFRNYVKV